MLTILHFRPESMSYFQGSFLILPLDMLVATNLYLFMLTTTVTANFVSYNERIFYLADHGPGGLDGVGEAADQV